jgi:hypothetical protein
MRFGSERNLANVFFIFCSTRILVEMGDEEGELELFSGQLQAYPNYTHIYKF